MSSSAEDEQNESEDVSSDETCEEENEVKQQPAFTQSIKQGSQSIHDQLDENLDIEDEAQDLSDEKDFSRPELCSVLSNLARQEINTNRQMYRSLMYQNLAGQNPNWDANISKVEKVNKIDELIDTSIQVWVDRHIEEFVTEIKDQDNTTDLRDIAKLTIGAGIIRGVIERVTSDAIYNYGQQVSSDIVDWFVANTPLSPNHLFEAVESMLRALFAV